ncbi:MAG: hypothetical protein ACI9FJ_002979, partial [Alteromonadaceae bacterium]
LAPEASVSTNFTTSAECGGNIAQRYLTVNGLAAKKWIKTLAKP